MKKTYLVTTKTQQTATSVQAEEVVVEPSGALSFYDKDANRKSILQSSFASGEWVRVAISANA